MWLVSNEEYPKIDMIEPGVLEVTNNAGTWGGWAACFLVLLDIVERQLENRSAVCLQQILASNEHTVHPPSIDSSHEAVQLRRYRSHVIVAE